MEKVIKHFWGLFILLLVSIIPLLPLFHAGFFPMHDDTQVARVFEMGKSLHDGMIPVRWSQDLGFGYGYPMFTFYAPLAFYVGGIITLFGISSLISTKIIFALGIVFSGICMYFFARSIWGEAGGVLSGILYLYAPYHALDIYVRGDMAEFWAYACIPLAFFGIWKTFQTRKVAYSLIGAVGFAGIILSHNLTALMVTPFLLIFMVLLIGLSKKKKLTIYYLLFTTILGLLLSAFYWFPVPFETTYTNVLSQVSGGADFHKNFVCLQQLWNSPWGYGGSIPGCADGISFALGKIYIVLFGVALLIFPFVMKKDKVKGVLLLGSLVGVGISLFMLLPNSLPIWNIVHVLSFLQYPWRFLLLVFFFLSFAFGSLCWLINGFTKKYVFGVVTLIIIGVILVVVQGKYFVPQKYLTVDNNSYANNYALTWVVSNITSEYMPTQFKKPTKYSQVPQQLFVLPTKNDTFIQDVNKTSQKETRIHMNTPGAIQITLAYFPGWHAYLDGKEIPLKVTSQGTVVSVAKGDHVLSLAYKDTLVETVGNFMSLFGIVVAILAIIVMGKYEKNS